MDRVAAEVAATLPLKDLAKFPARWHPAFSAKKAGSPEQHDSWGDLWFESLTNCSTIGRPKGFPSCSR
jgi:hypothetical protein